MNFSRASLQIVTLFDAYTTHHSIFFSGKNHHVHQAKVEPVHEMPRDLIISLQEQQQQQQQQRMMY